MGDRRMLLLGAVAGLVLALVGGVLLSRAGRGSSEEIATSSLVSVSTSTTTTGSTPPGEGSDTTPSTGDGTVVPTTQAPSTPTTAPSTGAATTGSIPSGPSSSGSVPTMSPATIPEALRCDPGGEFLAVGQGERFAVSLCVRDDGTLIYRGLRHRDQAAIALPACFGSDGWYRAENNGFVYRVAIGEPDGYLELTDAAGEVVVWDILVPVVLAGHDAVAPC